MTLLEIFQRKKQTISEKLKVEKKKLQRKVLLKKYVYYTKRINELTAEEANREVKIFGKIY
jgi:hypothetical protein